MAKLLEKVIKDAIEDDKCVFGSRQVLNSIKNSKLVIYSNSTPNSLSNKILESAKNAKVPTLNYGGSSVDLGKLCGQQFRVSAISLKTLSDSNFKAIMKDFESRKRE